MMQPDASNPEFKASPPRMATDVERLRNKIDFMVAQIVAHFGDDIPLEMVGRALLAKGANVLLENKGMIAAIWGVQRVEDLLAGHWTKDTTDLFIQTKNR